MAIEISEAVRRLRAEVVRDALIGKKERVMDGRGNKKVFTVYEVANGFLAEFSDGTVVVGKKMQETVDDAIAQAATRALRNDDEQNESGAKAVGQAIPVTPFKAQLDRDTQRLFVDRRYDAFIQAFRDTFKLTR